MISNVGTSSIDTKEIRVINARTEEDITQDVLWSKEASDPDLVLELRFDEGSGTKAIDTSGQGNEGALKNDTGTSSCFTNGACPVWVDGKRGGALEFDGDGDYVDCGNDASLDITDEITLEAWVYNEGQSGHRRGVVGKRHSNEYIYGLVVENNEFAFLSWLSVPKQEYTSGVKIKVDQWTHIVATVSSSNVVKLYANGKEAKEEYTLTTKNMAGNGKIRIGASGATYFNGLIDEVRIYDRALSPSKIEDLAENSVTVEAGETAYMTHTCKGRCSYKLVLGGSARKASLEC